MGERFAFDIDSVIIDGVEKACVPVKQMLNWNEEKVRISHFYKVCFNCTKWENPDLTCIFLPEVTSNLKRPDYIFPEMNQIIDVAFDSYANYFGKDKVWKAWEKIADAIDFKTIQSRPERDYFFIHAGGYGPDILDKSYDDGIHENIIFMTPLEGIISSFRYRFETGIMYDVFGLTKLSSLDKNGNAMDMCGRARHGRFILGSDVCNYHHPDYGLREVKY